MQAGLGRADGVYPTLNELKRIEPTENKLFYVIENNTWYRTHDTLEREGVLAENGIAFNPIGMPFIVSDVEPTINDIQEGQIWLVVKSWEDVTE